MRMAYEDENTSVVRMKRDFDQFVQDESGRGGLPMFSLDVSSHSTSFHNMPNDTATLSVQALLEKEKQARLKESEVIEAKVQIFNLEGQINSMETSNKRARIEYDKEIGILQVERSHDSEKLGDAWRQLRQISAKEETTRTDLADAQRDLGRQRQTFEARILELQKDKFHLEDNLQQNEELSREKITELKRDLMRNTTELKIGQCELEETKAQLKLQLRRSSEIMREMAKLKECGLTAEQGEQRIKDLELQVSRMEEDSVVAKAMKSQVNTFHEMEKENRKLRDENQYLRDIQENILLLKEENMSMKRKQERFQETLDACTKAQLENEKLTSRLEKWEGDEKAVIKVRSPSDMRKRVTELQNSEALMLSRQGELQSSLHSQEREVRGLQEQLHAVRDQLLGEKAKQQQQADLIKRLQRKLLLATKERDAYKRVIDSYESEVTLNVSAGSLQRVQQLEENMRAYQKHTEYLEAELGRNSTELAAVKHTNRQLELRLGKMQQMSNGTATSDCDQQTFVMLREQIAGLETSLEKCDQDRHLLECKIEQRHLQGDYDPTKVKVLHFKMNPADVAAERRRGELRQLEEENERLRERVRLLEESGGAIEDLTVAVEQKLLEPSSSKDIEEMNMQLASAELKNQRLMEAFRKTSQEVREVCYQLTGYKIDIPTTNNYRLTSMYAQSPADHMLFQHQPSGEIQMLGTDFSTTVPELIEQYLGGRDSIPAFLGALTLRLLNTHTASFS